MHECGCDLFKDSTNYTWKIGQNKSLQEIQHNRIHTAYTILHQYQKKQQQQQQKTNLLWLRARHIILT